MPKSPPLFGKANSSHDETLETYVAGTMKSMSSSGGWSNSVDHAAAGYMVPVETYPINTQIALRHEATGRGTGMGRGVPILPIAFDAKGTQVQFEEFGVASTLRSMGHANSHKNGGGHSAVALNIYGGNKRSDRPDGGFYVSDDGVSKTLDSSTGLNPTAAQGGTAIVNSWAVRRLTPVECARLQGFSDTYLDLPNKPLADGPKYKMLGNSMAVNVMRWIGQRIEMVEGLTKKRGLANQSPSSLPPLG